MSTLTIKEIDYAMKVFDLLLFYASEEGRKPLPKKEHYLVLELTAALREYLMSDGESVLQASDFTPMIDNWIRNANQDSREALDQGGGKMNPALVQVLREFSHIEWQHDYGESWWQSGMRFELSRVYKGGYDKTFCLTVPFVEKVKQNIVRNLDADTVNHCREIGKLMRKYIDRDLALAN